MNRNLHHTFALLISGCALALGLFAAMPAALPEASADATSRGPIAAQVKAVARQIAPRAVDTVAALDNPFEHTAATPAALQKSRHASGKSRRMRQSMAMPFFSFAPRG